MAAKRLEESKAHYHASLLRLENFIKDFEALHSADTLPADLTQAYEDIQNENKVFKRLHNKHSQLLVGQPDSEQIKEELAQINYDREKYRNAVTRMSEHYNRVLKVNKETDVQNIEDKMREIETTAGATAAAAAAEVVKAFTSKQGTRSELERLPCPSWDGKRTTYATFKKHFNEAMVHNRQEESKQLLRLRSAIKDPGSKWKRNVETCSEISRAWTLLDREFCNNQKLISEIYSNLDRFHLKASSSNSLSEFAIIIRELIQQFEDIGKPEETKCEVFMDKLRKKIDSVTLENFQCFIELKGKCESSENLADWLDFMSTIRADIKPSGTNNSGQKYSNYKPNKTSSNFAVNTANTSCPMECTENHKLIACPKFGVISVQERWKIIRKQKRCRKCFELHHTGKCNKTLVCNKCERPHHSLLHIEFDSSPLLNPDAKPFATGTNQSLMSEGKTGAVNVMSAQCPVQKILVKGINGQKKPALIFQDSGSDICLMRKAYASNLGLHGEQITLNMLLAGGEHRTELAEVLNITVSPLDDEQVERTFKVYIINHPCTNAKTVSKNSLSRYSHLQPLLDKLYLDGGKIDILIGTEFSDAFVDMASKIGQSGQPIAKKNLFGWYLLGSIDDKTEFKSCNFVKSAATEHFNNDNTNDNIKDLLYQDQVGIKPTKYCVCSDDSLKENRFIKIIGESTELINGRIQVKMPWVPMGPPQCSNYDLAYKRMESTQRSLIKKDKLKVVNDEVEKLVDSNFVKIINPDDVDHSKPEFYLPMQVVFTPGKSTEVRLVFDSSAKGHDGLSLNDRLEKGPNLLNNLFDVLLAWRWDNVAYSGDIQKMFNQVLVHPDDQIYHRSLWRSSPSEKPKIYQWIRLSFGDKPAPSIASNAINILAKYSENSYPEAAKELLSRTYVDDIAGSKSDVQQAKNVINNIDAILDNGKFKIKCWHSNHEVINQNTSEKVTSILGHSWNKTSDTFTFKKSSITEIKGLFNKRKCLAAVAQVWDPIGLVSAVTIKFRMDMQHLWALGFNWDQSLPDELQTLWTNSVQTMDELLKIPFERQLKPENSVGQPEVHGFCDGSETAYGAVIFLRWKLDNNEFTCIPVIIKALVAPLKKKSIPRLELLGCLLLTRMFETCIKALAFAEVSKFPVYLWCDSTTALKWVKTPPQKFRPFVSARVAEIQETLNVQNFKYIPSEYNHADTLTHGIEVSKLSQWLEGPPFLKQADSEWPDFEIKLHTTETEKTLVEYKITKGTVCVGQIQDNKPTKLDILNKLLNSTSSYRKVRRYTCHIIRFAKYIAKKKYDTGPFTTSELKHSQNVLIKWSQTDLQKPQDKLGILVKLDENGIIRAHGRLENIRTLPLNQRNPIVLPKDNKVVKLLLQHLHEIRGHCGYESLIAEAKKCFWIFGLRNTAKKLTRDCITCKKLRQKPLGQIMGQLPELRVAVGLPVFFNTALDMFGPIQIKLNRKTLKEAHVLIFACMTSRAIHLELVTNKSSDNFIMALRRFTCLRGNPSNFWSDQGTNFVGAQSYLAEIMKDWNVNKLKNVVTENFHKNLEITWNWNVPHASHMNGVVESLIKSVRNALNASCKMSEYTEEQWHTILAEATFLVNSRPLYPASNKIFEEPPITPNDIIYGPHITPPQPINEERINPRHLNKSVQNRVAEFWKCWIKYFPPNLLPRNKWFRTRENIQVGDLVLEIDTNVKRAQWKMAVIQQVYPGKDGQVRKVKIKTETGLYDRPIHKLCLIATNDELINSA